MAARTEPAMCDPASNSAAERLLRSMFDAAVARAQPDVCVPPALPDVPSGRTIVIGAGKAAATMARAVERHWNGPIEGLVVTRHGHAVPCARVAVREAGHPVPDAAGVAATREMLGLLRGLQPEDLVLCLISGGGSALLAAPPPGVTLGELQELSQRLLRSGAKISQMNCIRKHLSMVAGGRLAQMALPARVVTLAISDVPGDNPATIACGPTIADPTSRQDALTALDELGIDPAPSIRSWLMREESETPKPGDLPEPDCRMIASSAEALRAAADVARDAGYVPLILGSDIEGEARELGVEDAALALAVKGSDGPPCVLLSGGETSVTVRGSGKGGRNAEYLLALTMALNGAPGIHALAADTDGIDGTGTDAGAVMGPHTIAAAQAAGLSCDEAMKESDSHRFFEAARGLVTTGPTFTNVNDFRAILIEGCKGAGGC